MSEPKFSDHFSAVATGYATFRPSYPSALFAALAGAAPSRALAWDCGCGTGQASVALGSCFEQVVATDASAAQIAYATPHARVTYGVAPAEQSDLADESVALITVAQALHWFDVDAFHTEASRVLMPNGVIAEWSYALLEFPSVPRLTQLMSDFDRTMGEWWPKERALVDRHYRDLAFPFAAIDIGTFAMNATWSVEQLLGYVGTWSAVSRCRVSTGHDPLIALTAALRETWGAQTTQQLVWPLTLRVGRLQTAV